MVYFLCIFGGLILGCVFGGFVGFTLSKRYISKCFEQIVVDFVEAECQKKGAIAFTDGRMAIHCLNVKDFGVLVSNMLKYSPANTEM